MKLLLLLILTACNTKEQMFVPAVEPIKEQTPVERGKEVYATHCSACHSNDPVVGRDYCPPIAFSSEELLNLKILKGMYPKKHRPKRKTKSMPVLPNLKEDIHALYEYLNSFPRK